ncbi:MAG: hypothetical protein O2954_00415 [bacterium]|nr:hypothetical protein [bacterium]
MRTFSRVLVVLTVVLLAATAWAESVDFYGYWADGKGEISSYRVIQPRYGEAREGYGVMIFVTEDLNRRTLIKVESPTPKEDRVYTLKLNNVLKFTTGIYDYSVMTSVFSAVEGFAGPGPFELVKVNLSSQEWCGHVFDEFRIDGGRLKGELNSYFEREGKHPYELPTPAGFVSEDHLLIWIRELKGLVMKTGESQTVKLLPSLWSFRQRHRPHALVDAKLEKNQAVSVTVGEKTYEAVPWRWSWEGFEKTVWVDVAYPHRILKWKDSRGDSGELMVTMREPYWKLHGEEHREYRERLQIP